MSSLLSVGSRVHGCWRDAAAPLEVQPLGQSERGLCTADSCAAPWEVKLGVTKIRLLALQCVPGLHQALLGCAQTGAATPAVFQCTPPGGGQWHVHSGRVKLGRGNQHVGWSGSLLPLQ